MYLVINHLINFQCHCHLGVLNLHIFITTNQLHILVKPLKSHYLIKMDLKYLLHVLIPLWDHPQGA